MTSEYPNVDLEQIDIDEYTINSLDDELRVDRLCVGLIRQMFQTLTQQQTHSPEQAGEMCHGIDYFLREFIIGDRCENLFTIAPERIRQFAGHWYIIRTVEPNMTELGGILAGTKTFY
ncbi:MAG: hypothetical protein OET90_11800, partial [Desulfuromonadales bacterium]|nr:hypothetical protein [Desulfuromonadales bacterium]